MEELVLAGDGVLFLEAKEKRVPNISFQWWAGT
jgi:hypothetical protein